MNVQVWADESDANAFSMRAWLPVDRCAHRRCGAGNDSFDQRTEPALQRGVIAVQPAVADLAPTLAAVRIPTLVIVGARDRLSLDASRALARALPNAELVEIPDAGHLVNLARPTEFNAAVAAFLDALPPESA